MWIQQPLYYENWRCSPVYEACRVSVSQQVSWKLEMDRLHSIYLQKAAEHWADWSFSLFVIARLCVHRTPWWSGDPAWCDAEPEFSKQRVGAPCVQRDPVTALPAAVIGTPSHFVLLFIMFYCASNWNIYGQAGCGANNVTIKNQAWPVPPNVLLITNYSPCEFWYCQTLSDVWCVLGR